MTRRQYVSGRWLLPLSLAVNVFLIAVIAVHEWRRPHGPPRPEHLIAHLSKVLSAADAATLRQAFEAETILHARPHPPSGSEGTNGPGSPEGEDMAAIRQALRAEPFDPEALAAAFARGHAVRDARDQAIGRVLLKVATAISAEGRQRLADLRGPPGPP